MTKETTYHVDLGHCVDEYDGEYRDGQPEEEGPGEVPQDAPEPDRQQQHQDDGDPDEGREEEEQQYRRARKHQGLKASQQEAQHQGARQGGREANVRILLMMGEHDKKNQSNQHNFAL